MTTYKEIRGTHIKTVTTDPPAPVNGQMWYNSTTQVMKGLTANPVGSWATSTSVNTATGQMGGNGTSTSALIYGGNVPADQAKTESWNGSSWTEVNDLNTGRSTIRGSGSYTSAIGAASGSAPTRAATETWNGTIWRKDSDINTGRDGGAMAGSSNSEGIYFGGRVEPTLYANTEEFSAGAVSTKTISTD